MNNLLKRFSLLVFILSFSPLIYSATDNFKNPILSGFYPDPSITRSGDTYYMTNSTFEWFPALPIHKSKDLVNWELVGYGISDATHLNLQEGLNDSLGIFAPTIRYHDNTFYIITTCVGCGGNFIITAKDPAGPWSKPTWLKGAIGIDPSLYWEDGKSYYLGAGLLEAEDKTQWPGKNGIWMQEIDIESASLLGQPKQLTFGHAANARWAEGPRLFKIDGEYMLLIGEGGTNEFHAVTVFNSQSLWGPYVPNHANPVLTHRHLQNTYPIAQTGHADLVQTQDEQWWSVVLAKRPQEGITLLSRETFLAKVVMSRNESGVTPIFNPGVGLLQPEQPRPNLPWTPVQQEAARDEFNANELSLQWNFLRTPSKQRHALEAGALHLALAPQRIEDLANPAFVARRIKHHSFHASTALNFSSTKQNEKAGLVLYRRSTNHYQLLKQANELVLQKTSKRAENGKLIATEIARVPYTHDSIIMRVDVNNNMAQFSFGQNESQLAPIGAPQSVSILSDEVTQRFNGNYVGMYATSSGLVSKAQAQFNWFEYSQKN
ncbi:Alpha-L-arabinofuranosidase [Paraglaciecola sp. T6c]|uniref:glycoside hydrolase family 43 protein n=1 Tax=Pseudoalteromonas atlantica (strain T6c / ATCC BAA-1087) TaxID=3042615 RepID=UPI00005C6C47|nr:glycoside hydrolase family 43 protein [Paraglaciecola sp. T6c]ABG39370.1 Alpha-L-arabinofuranosidase [Paraglaciecola sp. T6c]